MNILPLTLFAVAALCVGLASLGLSVAHLAREVRFWKIQRIAERREHRGFPQTRAELYDQMQKGDRI